LVGAADEVVCAAGDAVAASRVGAPLNASASASSAARASPITATAATLLECAWAGSTSTRTSLPPSSSGGPQRSDSPSSVPTASTTSHDSSHDRTGA
jgi:hypothetical protein